MSITMVHSNDGMSSLLFFAVTESKCARTNASAGDCVRVCERERESKKEKERERKKYS